MLIIYAHPNKDGHSGYCLKKLTEYLAKEKIDYELLDLYAMKYDPVLTNEELKDKKNLSKETLEIQKKIKDHENLVFIYPTWWQNVPAILKGFIDKVFTTGFAFTYKNNIPEGLLKGKRAVVFTSSGGPELYTKILAQERSLKVVTVDTLKFCGIDAKGFLVGSAVELTASQKEKIDRNVKKGINFVLK